MSEGETGKIEPGSTLPSVKVGGILAQAKGWMSFLGVLILIGGIIQALTIVGLFICWLPIWMGVLLMQAGSAAKRYSENYNNPDLLECLNKTKNFFKIAGILSIISLAVTVVWLIVILILTAFGYYDLSQILNYYR